MTISEASGNQSENRSPLTRQDGLVALLFAVLVVCLGCGLIVKGVSAFDHDDGIYLITAKAIAQGDGYRMIHLPNSPIQTKYPFLYPAILSLVWKVFPAFPNNLLWMQWISLISGAATVALAYLYLIRFNYASRGIAAAALSFCVTSPQFLFFCSSCLSEMPFALLLAASMWALDRHLEKPFPSPIMQFLSGVLLVLPLFCRMIGAVSVAVIGVLAVRHGKRLLWPIIGAGVAAFPFIIWMVIFSKWTDSVSSNIYYTNYVTWWNSYGIPFIARVFAVNAFNVFFGSIPVSQMRWLSIPYWLWLGTALLGLVSFVLIVLRIRNLKSLPIFLVGYVAVVLVWPWPSSRFLVPVLPYLFAFSISGAAVLFRKAGWALKPAGYAIAAVILGFDLQTLRGDIATTHESRYPAYMQAFYNRRVDWQSYREMFDWIKKSSTDDDVFISGLDPMIYLYTGRRAARPFAVRPATAFYNDSGPALGPLSEVMGNIKFYKAQYLVLCPMPGFSEEIPYGQFVVEAQQKYPGWLERVYLGNDKHFAIWKIRY